MAIYDYEVLPGFLPSSVDQDKYRLKRKFAGNPKNPIPECEYGLSRFQLNTFDENTEIICKGVLEEMPEISFSVDYTDGPGTLWQDMLQQFMSNDLFNLVNAIGSANTGGEWTNLLNGGSWTKKIYNGYNPGTIQLKFKIFTADTLYQTPALDWIKYLSRYAAISNKNTFTFERARKNITSGLNNVSQTSYDMASEHLRLANKDNEKSKQENKSVIEEDVDKAKKDRDEFLRYIAALSSTKVNFLNQTKVIDFGKTEGGIPSSQGYYKFSYNTEEKKLYLVTFKGGSEPGKQDDHGDAELKNETKMDFDNLIDELTGKVINYDDHKKVIKSEYEKAQKAAEEWQNPPAKTDDMSKVIDKWKEGEQAVRKGMNALGSLVKKYGPLRVADTFNRQNSFGAKLWYLHIYSGTIFKKKTPLIVYISDWSVKRSEESNSNGPYYYEFSITCNLDQTYSRAQWYRVLETDITNGANWGKKKDSLQYEQTSGMPMTVAAASSKFIGKKGKDKGKDKGKSGSKKKK